MDVWVDREGDGEGGRRWEEETGKERESDRKKGNSMGWGGVGTEAGAQAEISELQSQGVPAGKGKG